MGRLCAHTSEIDVPETGPCTDMKRTKVNHSEQTSSLARRIVRCRAGNGHARTSAHVNHDSIRHRIPHVQATLAGRVARQSTADNTSTPDREWPRSAVSRSLNDLAHRLSPAPPNKTTSPPAKLLLNDLKDFLIVIKDCSSEVRLTPCSTSEHLNHIASFLILLKPHQGLNDS